MKDFTYLEHNFCLPNILDRFFFRQKKDPDVFLPSGLICFCGSQGSGKTLSSVLYLRNLLARYPKALVVSNIHLDFCDYIPYTGLSQLHDIQNGIYGVIIFLDEIQIEFNSLESKTASIPIFELVCQQRKQRKHIIGTTQVFGRLQKPFREQFKYVVLCDNFAGYLFRQAVYSAKNIAYDDDIKTELSPECVKFYIPSKSDFSLYDTYQVVERVRSVIN